MAIVETSDLDQPLLRPFGAMADGQLRRGEGFRRDCPDGLFIAESAKVTMRALEAGVKPLSMLVDGRWLAHDRQMIDDLLQRWPATPVFKVTPAQFRAITGYEVVRGALTCFERPRPLSPDEVLSGARRIAVLEDVTNYANMGAIFRSAAALGMDGVLLSPSCHDPLYRRCARVSMGAVFQIPWARLDGTADWALRWVPRLQGQGFLCAAFALDSEALGLRDPRLAAASKLAMVLGTEGEGLRDDTIAACDLTVCIPMAHGVDSLNVAACAAIAFWETGHPVL